MEKDLAKQIRQSIEGDKCGVSEVSAATFVKLWGNNTIEKLMEFSEKNKFGHVIILQGNRMIGVKFWKIKAKNLLKEEN